jgi:hypothetical protein
MYISAKSGHVPPSLSASQSRLSSKLTLLRASSLRTGLVSSMASGLVMSVVSHIFDNDSTQAVRDEDDWKLITSRRSVILSLYKNVTQG